MLRASLCIVLLPAWCLFAAQADDVVRFRGGKDGQQALKRMGKIQDYTGTELTIVSSTGRSETIPADRVIEVQTSHTPEETQADQLAAEGKLREAVQSYLAARRIESRAWVTRRFHARLIDCYMLQGQIDAAAEEFFALLAEDPESPDFFSIPLAWRTAGAENVLGAHAAQWLGNTKQPAAVLLGASWLLAGAQRAEAIAALNRLASDIDPRIAQLAAAQLWRTKIVTAVAADVNRWNLLIAKMPRGARQGPLLLVGDALARQKQADDALLAYLQVATLYTPCSTLTCDGYVAAAGLLEKQKRTADAARLYAEVLRKFPKFAGAADVQSRLAAISAHIEPPNTTQ